MTETSNIQFLTALFNHTNHTKSNLHLLSHALNLTPGATSMRLTRLKQKLAKGDTTKISARDTTFLEAVLRSLGGKTDLRGVAAECGISVGAASMRFTRLRKKWEQGEGRTKGGAKGGGSGKGGEVKEEWVIKVEDEEDGGN